MDRREVLRKTVLGAAGVGVASALAGCGDGATESGVAAPAIVKKRRTLNVVTTWPKGLPGLGESAERIAKNVEAMTEGAIAMKIYSAGELVPAFESFDAVANGNADIYHGAEYYWQGKSQAFNFFTAVPMGLTATENNAWIYHGGGQELWDELSAGFNIKAMPAGNTGVQMGGWFRNEINTLEDFKGLKVRMPGLGGEVLRRLGASAEALAGPEINQALINKRIDATEWVGPWNDQAMGFYKAADPIYYYVPGFHEPGSTLALGVNLGVWDSLSASERTIIQQAAMAEDSFNLAQFNHHNASALRNLVNNHGVNIRSFSTEIMTEIGRLSGEVVKEAAASDDITRRVYESFLAARVDSMTWSEISEEAYMRDRRLEFPYG
jgi:TRAP-type mannitol/chloroaromatic compound transport system substrate-binding protein